jgi:hypothetical protein
MAWVWVPKRSVFGIQAKSLATYGGADGVRDEGLIESARAAQNPCGQWRP